MKRLAWGLVLLGMLAGGAQGAGADKTAGTKLDDDFAGSSVSSKNWHIPTWRAPDDGTYVGRTQFRCAQNAALPLCVNGGEALVPVETFNPAGASLYGTDLISNQTFELGSGLTVTVRARINPPVLRGTVAGIFLYGIQPGEKSVHDEIDFELLGNFPDQAQTNVYAHEELGAGRPVRTKFESGSSSDFHVYQIKWLPERVEWLLDGKLIREERAHVPKGAMSFHLNMWAPGQDWPVAYDGGLQPVRNSADNRACFMIVDSVKIEREEKRE